MSRRAFTLIELLVVMGIIALLAGLLLPALNAARERSRQTQCASNLRTLAIGVLAYSQENHGLSPGMATVPQQSFDWIYWTYWEPPYDVFGGGAICRYIGKEQSVFRCPSDDAVNHWVIPGGTELPKGPYRYSYIINPFANDIQRLQCCVISAQVKLTNVRNNSEKILLLEGNEQTLLDGVWVPPPNIGSYVNDLGDRHDRHSSDLGKGRANVAFIDTHVEFVTPAFAHEPAHYAPGL